MKTSLIVCLLVAIAFWFGQCAGHKSDQWTADLQGNGAAAGSALAEMQETMAARECQRRNEVGAAAQARRQREQDEAANQAAHKAVWDEIERLSK